MEKGSLAVGTIVKAAVRSVKQLNNTLQGESLEFILITVLNGQVIALQGISITNLYKNTLVLMIKIMF